MSSVVADPRENGWVTDVKSGKYVSVPIDSFVRVAVLSGQVTSDEIGGFIELAARQLSTDTSYSVAGERWLLQVSGGDVFIFETGGGSAFWAAKATVQKILNAIQGTITGEAPSGALPDFTIRIRGVERFFDFQGPEFPDRAWVGLDLRK